MAKDTSRSRPAVGTDGWRSAAPISSWARRSASSSAVTCRWKTSYWPAPSSPSAAFLADGLEQLPARPAGPVVKIRRMDPSE